MLTISNAFPPERTFCSFWNEAHHGTSIRSDYAAYGCKYSNAVDATARSTDKFRSSNAVGSDAYLRTTGRILTFIAFVHLVVNARLAKLLSYQAPSRAVTCFKCLFQRSSRDAACASSYRDKRKKRI